MKYFKKSKTKTSKSKTSKAKTSKTKTTKTKTSKTKTPKYFLRKALFCLFRNSCALERNCLMTASKNPENIQCTDVKHFRPLSFLLRLLVWLKIPNPPTIFTKMHVDFSSSSRLFASGECLKSVKNSRNEGFQEVEN